MPLKVFHVLICKKNLKIIRHVLKTNFTSERSTTAFNAKLGSICNVILHHHEHLRKFYFQSKTQSRTSRNHTIQPKLQQVNLDPFLTQYPHSMDVLISGIMKIF